MSKLILTNQYGSKVKLSLPGKVAGGVAGSMATDALWHNKGDLAAASGSAAAGHLTVGSDGQVLMADSTATLGIKWAALPSGLPDMTGAAGKYLKTDGTAASWVTVGNVINCNTGTGAGNVPLLGSGGILLLQALEVTTTALDGIVVDLASSPGTSDSIALTAHADMDIGAFITSITGQPLVIGALANSRQIAWDGILNAHYTDDSGFSHTIQYPGELSMYSIITWPEGGGTLLTTGSPLNAANINAGVVPVSNLPALAVSTLITSSSPTGGVGYATGAGGAVTQATSRSTGVTLNKVTGAITMNSTSLAAAANVSFTLTNSAIAATDLVVVNVKSYSTGQPVAWVTKVAAGSCEITVRNQHASTADTTADVLQFAVLKGVNS